MIKVRKDDLKWQVIEDGKVLREFKTHAEAWRFVDVETGELLNRQQKVSDWLFSKTI